jgi:hypothetical protein
MNTTTKIYSALFVDFDNMYLSLKDSKGQETADAFASNPTAWLEWLEKGMSREHFGEDGLSRQILIRKCYLNPGSFREFRPLFTRAAFEVVDCPKLTKEGKTSTDIHMVMDIMDALQHPSHFDEFILLSADADFTPVLLRVRQHKRLSAVIGAGYVSPAYKSASDYLPSLDLFLQQALGIAQAEEEEVKTPVATEVVAEEVFHALADVVLQKLTATRVVNADELPALYKRVDAFRESTTWLGLRSLRSLSQAVVNHQPELCIIDDRENGSWGIQRSLIDPKVSYAPAVELNIPIPEASLSVPVKNEEPPFREVARVVIEKVRQSSKPVPMANLAALVREQCGSQLLGNGWLGAESFKALLLKLDLDGLELSNITPGYVYDPQRHTIISDSQGLVMEESRGRIVDEFKKKHPAIEALASKIHQVTDMPYLLPEHYAMVLQQLARAVNEKGFQFNQTARLVRDRCVERGIPVARTQINFILNAILYTGYRFNGGKKPEKPETLARALYEDTIDLCESAQMVLSVDEKQRVWDWMVNCLGVTTQNAK